MASSSVDRSSVVEEAFEGGYSHFSPKEQVSAQLGGHVSPSTLRAHQMARAGVAAHSSSAATEVAFDVEYLEDQDLWCACQWDPTRPGHAWYIVHQEPPYGGLRSCRSGDVSVIMQL